MGQKRRDFLKSLAVIGGVSMINLPALVDNQVAGCLQHFHLFTQNHAGCSHHYRIRWTCRLW